MTAKHTPGPWQLTMFGGEPRVTVAADATGYQPRIAYIDECFAHFEGQHLRGETMETANRTMRHANAHLIAAAPELLEVAQRCLAMVSEGAGPPNWDWIREVIAKATDA